MMLVLGFVMLVPWISACPSPCACYISYILTNSGLTVNCRNKGITSEQLETMEFPTDIIEIRLDTNQLTYIPEPRFARIEGLRYLYLYANKLTTLHENTFAHNTNLKRLDLKNNNLRTIHENTFAHNTNLKRLDLTNNNLRTIHENTFAHNTNLEWLYLTNNKLTTLHENTLANNTKLKRLDLSFNNLNTIHENTFVHNTNLERLYLKNNNLTPLHENTLANNTKLKRLDLRYNKLNTIHENTFAHNTNLNELHLDGNNLTTIHENTFAHNTNSKYLFMENNPLHCDCRMQNMLSMNIRRLLGTCQSPEKMKGISLINLVNNLNCTSCATLDPCKNDGECFSLDEVQYECRCKLGYHGNHCELQELPSISLKEVEGGVMLSCVIKASWLPNKVYWIHEGVTRMAQPSRSNGSGGGPTASTQKDIVFDLEVTSYTQLGTYSCRVFDEDLMTAKVESHPFEVYYPGPTFTSVPSLLRNGEKGYEGGFSSNSSIKGCQFSSKFPLTAGINVYWLKDGYKNMSHNFSRNNKMNDLHIGLPSLSEMGYYQCAIFIPGYTKQPILSQAVSVQSKDSTSAKLSIRLAWEWKDEFLNRMSEEFKSLENALGNELSKVFKNPFIVILNVRKGSVIADVRVTMHSPQEEEIMKACDLRVEASSFVEITVFNVQRLDCCPSVTFGDSNYTGEYTFPKALTGRSVSQRCTYNSVNDAVGKVSRECLGDLQTGPRWSDADFSKCKAKLKTTQDLINLSVTKICTTDSEDCSPVGKVAKNLTQTVANGTQLKIYQDVDLTATTIGHVVKALNYTNQTEQVVNDVLKTVNSVLEAEVQIVADAQIKEIASTKILQSLDKLASKVRKVFSNKTTFAVSKPNIALRLQQVNRSDVMLLAKKSGNGTVEISVTNTSLFYATPASLAVIRIPNEAFNSSSDVVHSYFFKQDSLFLTERQLLKRSGRQPHGGLVVQSNVFSASIGDVKVENLSTPIILTFKKTKRPDSSGNDSCQFWNPKIETIVKGVFGKWSNEGCGLFPEGLNNDEFTSCQCDHLTNFALLLDMNQNAENPLELQIVTWIGCGISLAGLFLTVLIHAVFPNIRKKLEPKILMCLCVSLIGLLISFLAGAEQNEPRILCQVAAGVIHFFTLSTFCWMLVEAVNIYRKIVLIFNRSKFSDKNLFIKANLFCWGVPAIIVIVTGALRPEDMGNDKICMIRGHPFYFSIVLPVCLILLVNFILLGVTMHSLTNRSPRFRKRDKNYYKKHARIAFTCASLLGLSWLFGLLAVWKMTMVFQWIFCVTTSLQGLFIFMFHTIRNEELKKEWIRCIRLYNHQKDTPHSWSVQSASNNIKYQTQINMKRLPQELR